MNTMHHGLETAQLSVSGPPSVTALGSLTSCRTSIQPIPRHGRFHRCQLRRRAGMTK